VAVDWVQEEVRQVATTPKYALPFLQPGRLVRLLSSSDRAVRGATGSGAGGGLALTCEPLVTWGIVLNFERLGGMDADGNEVRRVVRFTTFRVDAILTNNFVTFDIYVISFLKIG
jgi:hypothetical protein